MIRNNKTTITKRLEMSIDIDIEISEVLYRPKKDRPKFWSTQIFVTLRKFCHLGPTNNLGRRNFGLFLKFHIGVNFVFKYDISSFRLVNSHTIYYSYLGNGTGKCNKNTCRNCHFFLKTKSVELSC